MIRQTHQIQITNVNTETEDFSAEEPNAVLQLHDVFFRSLAIHTRNTKLRLIVMN